MLTATTPAPDLKQVYRQQYHYLEQGDIDRFLATWDQQAILHFGSGLPLAGPGCLEGKAAIAQFFRDLHTGLNPRAVRVIHCGGQAGKAFVEWTYGPAGADSLNWWVTQLRYNSAGLVSEARCYTDTIKLRELLTQAGLTL